jgi:DNA-binding NtrC family response regulator
VSAPNQIELRIGEGGAGQGLVLAAGREYTLGSAAGCDLVIARATVSRQHARVRIAATLEVMDLGSRNGSFIDGQRLQSQHWHALVGDHEWRIGSVPVRYTVLAPGDEELALALDSVVSSSDTPAPAEVTLAAGMMDRFTRRALPPLLRRAGAGISRTELARALGEALMRHLPLQALRIGPTADTQDCACWFESSLGPAPDNTSLCGSTRVDYALTPGHLVSAYSDLAELVDAALTLAQPTRKPPAERAEMLAWPQPETLDPGLRKLYRQARRVAAGDVHVLIRGESGTGKELFARFLHQHSGRPEPAFIAVNCAAFPEDLLEAELFGVEKGVATGVDARAGLFERAHGGTLFLDEIGDMAAATQARILRVLQEREVWRLGAHRARPAEVRVISATHRDLASLRESGAFRTDLWHRIADWEIELPPLRARQADIGNLAVHFLGRAASARGIGVRGITRAALQALLAYEWPGNVRELEREMQRAAAFLDHDAALSSTELRPEIRAGASAAATDQSLAAQLARAEQRIIDLALAGVAGDIDRAAERLGISRATLYRRLATRPADAAQ